MDKIIYSKKAFEDLQRIKYINTTDNVLDGIIKINTLIDNIHSIEEKEFHEKYDDEFYFFKINEFFVFYMIDYNKIKIVRILSEDLDYINEIFN